MDNVITWFELPVKDMDRAKQFYATVMPTSFEDDEMDGFQMAILNHAENAVSGMLVLGDGYMPNATSAVVYLNGGKDLAEPLERVVQQGGEVAVPKTAICEGDKGYFAQFIDSEGNRVGLYSLPR